MKIVKTMIATLTLLVGSGNVSSAVLLAFSHAFGVIFDWLII